MMAANTFHKIVYGILRVSEWIVSLILAFLVLDVLWGVFTRFLIGEQSRWTEEFAIYLLIWVSLTGAAVTYYENGHLGVDYIVGKWTPEIRRLGQMAVHIIVLAFSIYGLLYGGLQLVSETIRSGQVSPAIGIPMSYVYSAVPVSGVLFTLFAVDSLLGMYSGNRRPYEEEKTIVEDV